MSSRSPGSLPFLFLFLCPHTQKEERGEEERRRDCGGKRKRFLPLTLISDVPQDGFLFTSTLHKASEVLISRKVQILQKCCFFSKALNIYTQVNSF